MSDRLQERLTDLDQHMDWPTAEVSAEVLRRIAQRDHAPRPVRGWVAAAVAAAAVVLVMAIPAGRGAIADLLGVVGIEVEWTDRLPPAGAFDELDLGRAVSLEDVSVGFPILVPGTDPPGPPDRVYLDDERVATVWGVTSELPAVVDTEIGLLHLQFVGSLDEALLTKQVAQDAEMRNVSVRGRSGLWIEDGPHVVAYLDRDGVELSETTRLAGNVLMWEEDGVTHRIESSLSLEDTLDIAERLTGDF
ncbi:MAG: hypothetical protein WD990_10510 [Acidimicrobiia bacterium]